MPFGQTSWSTAPASMAFSLGRHEITNFRISKRCQNDSWVAERPNGGGQQEKQDHNHKDDYKTTTRIKSIWLLWGHLGLQFQSIRPKSMNLVAAERQHRQSMTEIETAVVEPRHPP
ncbi:conserved hypothetical protein [Ricinus communis]|uniref:Uncharacterized protein n=1 Tax=Ricinus communis TaxID=3988 RepID=B9RB30_RICCO|nr:conserved hypothetical protein [Ricinus communis]